MQVETGHLIRQLCNLSDEEKKKLGYVPIPEDLFPAVEAKLAGKDEAMVSLTSGGKLSKWAAKKRKENRQKARQKMTKDSRKRNR